MSNQWIPRGEWPRYFDDFSRRHQGRATTVYVLSRRLGSQVEARDLAFEGIVSSGDGKGTISIHLGVTPARHVEHEIEEPRQVWVVSEADGDQALDIESTDGTQTLIQLLPRAPAARSATVGEGLGQRR